MSASAAGDLLAGVRDGAWLDVQDFSGVLEAGQLAREQCSAQCLVADEPGGEQACDCRCRGRYHGALATVLVGLQGRT